MTPGNNNTAILLMHCPDRTGLVAAVTDFLQKNNGNILSLDQYVDRENERFFMRVEWQLENFLIPEEKIDDFFGTLIGNKFGMEWQLHFSKRKPRVAIFVSKMSHCLYDILQRYMSGEWQVEIPVIISNHDSLKYIADRFDINFKVFPITKETKAEQEAAEIALLKELDVDLIVLARYMQILSDDFVSKFPNQIINIHHSFLPALKGQTLPFCLQKRGENYWRYQSLCNRRPRRGPHHRSGCQKSFPQRLHQGPGPERQGFGKGGFIQCDLAGTTTQGSTLSE